MHELSIADAVVQIATENAGGRRVRRVDLKVGHLRQVVPSALEFAFELVAQGTPIEGAQLVIESVPAVGYCRRCERETVLEGFPWQCAGCGELELDVVRGEELLVDALELEEAFATNGGMAYDG
jgi:hydrogenase nickel incorporation protein HypA/HybF